MTERDTLDESLRHLEYEIARKCHLDLDSQARKDSDNVGIGQARA
jgi:hypothetical protein